MPGTPTTKWSLPTIDGSADHMNDGDTQINAALTAIDALLTPYSQGVLASRPVSTSGSPGKVGRRYFASDVGMEFVDLGTSWLMVTSAFSGTLAARPAANFLGRIYRATDTGDVYIDTASGGWVKIYEQQGAWSNLTLPTNVVSTGGYTAGARIEGGRVFLRGIIRNNTGSTISASGIAFTIPSVTPSLRPPTASVGINPNTGSFNNSVAYAPNAVLIATTGVGIVQANWPNQADMYLDDTSFSIT